jgi:hypothetical protein
MTLRALEGCDRANSSEDGEGSWRSPDAMPGNAPAEVSRRTDGLQRLAEASRRGKGGSPQ